MAMKDWRKRLRGALDDAAPSKSKEEQSQPRFVLDQAPLDGTPSASPSALTASAPTPLPLPSRRSLLAHQGEAAWTPQGRQERREAGRVTLDLRPLLRQLAPIAATGIAHDQVLRAAWLRALPGLVLRPTYVERSWEERAGTGSRIRTTLAVDAGTLAALARAADPLGVEGPWFLLRGQVEPAFWSALDALLGELETGDAPSA